jgi:hypothetical protein
MKILKLSAIAGLLLNTTFSFAQNKDAIMLPEAKFITGNNDEWRNPAFNDSEWKTLKTSRVWNGQGFSNYHGYAWYRIHVIIPSSLKNNALWKDSLRINMAHVNDVDETYLNGVKIGKTGNYPEDKGGYVSKWPAVRNYGVSTSNPIIKWDQDNVIAVRAYDGGGTGGIFMGTPFIDMLAKLDGIEFNINTPISFLLGKKAQRKIFIKNNFKTPIIGTLKYTITDQAADNVLEDKTIDITLAGLSSKELVLNFPHQEGIAINYTYTEKQSGNNRKYTEIAPYILTPAESEKPVFNGPAVLGVHKNSPVTYKIPVSGVKPLLYSATGLPVGLKLDGKTGIITGKIANDGDYKIILTASNSKGKSMKAFTIKAGKLLALTPPMGWNSWNCWGLSVSDEKVRSSANAMLQKGLADYGWSSINIDDGWQADKRAESGEIVAADKFPDMKKLSDYLHNSGLKFGIYSSPGPKTCGGYLGSYEHEAQDASTYNQWGVDYLKYDLCSYSGIIAHDTTLAAQQKPYIVMQHELQKQPRDIVYSLCQYGIDQVWKWGPKVDGNLWRTTGDIIDTWESLSNIGFRQERFSDYANPGGWNDPDMLIVGMVGWGENLHPTRLTPYEQYTHISLWSLLSAPLLIGCDMSKLDEFTLNLLKNREVLAIDQDELGKQAKRVINDGNIQVWVKQLADGSKAIGVFNLNPTYKAYKLNFKSIGVDQPKTMRDVWTQQAMAATAGDVSFNIPPHGVRLIKVK